jgi:hypothetical protein
MSMQKEEKSATSPWITLAILSSLGIIAMSAETMAIPDFIADLGYWPRFWSQELL